MLSANFVSGFWPSTFSAIQTAFTGVNAGFDAVLGARGSKLQLVLNAIFHLEASAGNLPAADYEAVRKMPMIKTAIPIAVGDNLRGFRLVASHDGTMLAGVEKRPQRVKELPEITGSPELVRKIWEDIDAFGNMYIWQLLLSF